MAQRLIDHQRGQRYGEILAVFHRDGHLEAEVFGTQLLNDCPQELWNGLIADDIARELGALVVKLNGPRYWLLDGLGSKGAPMEPVLREFNGILMRRIATVRLDVPESASYRELNVDRRAQFFFDAGKPVYELVNPEGDSYIMQALCRAVDPTMTEESLATLGDRLSMPDGWTYRMRVLEEELVVDTSDHVATVIQDEFENTYTRPV